MRATAWGRTTWVNRGQNVMPKAIDASVCPLGIELMPPRTSSLIWAPAKAPREITAATKLGTGMPTAGIP